MNWRCGPLRCALGGRVAGLIIAVAALSGGCTGTPDAEVPNSPPADSPLAPTTTPATWQSFPAGSVAPSPRSTFSTTSVPITGQPLSATVDGPVTDVVDGDTFKLTLAGKQERVRVLGIDTPERDECGYAAASAAAADLLQGTTVTLIADPTQDDRDRYGRLVRSVRLHDGSDLGHRLVTDGLAREYTYDRPYALQSDYRAAQKDAASAGRGLWAASSCGGFAVATAAATSPPALAISKAPTATTTAAGTPPSPDCAIKANISSNGRIYHVPGSRDYDRTSVDESRGERWFCSVSDAETAGWRPPGNG